MRCVNEAGKRVLGAASALMLVFALLLGVQAISAQADTADCGAGDVELCEVVERCFWIFCKRDYIYYAAAI